MALHDFLQELRAVLARHSHIRHHYIERFLREPFERCLPAFGKGHLLAAFGWNLLGPPLFLLFALVWIRALCVLLNRRRFPRAFDSFAERYRLVRYSAFTFAVFGVARIIYILIADPGSLRQTALSELWARLLYWPAYLAFLTEEQFRYAMQRVEVLSGRYML